MTTIEKRQVPPIKCLDCGRYSKQSEVTDIHSEEGWFQEWRGICALHGAWLVDLGPIPEDDDA